MIFRWQYQKEPSLASATLREDVLGLVEHEGVTVFLTTHNLAEAEKLCGLVGVIRKGKLLMVGSPNEIRNSSTATRAEILGHGFNDAALTKLRERPEVAAVERRNGNLIIDLRREADVAPLVGLLVSAGGAVEGVRKCQASLEDVFLSMAYLSLWPARYNRSQAQWPDRCGCNLWLRERSRTERRGGRRIVPDCRGCYRLL